MFQSILLDSTSGTLKEWFQNLWNDTGFVVDYSRFEGYSLGIWGCLIMLVVACFLVYLAVVKKFEPMLLVGIAFGAFLINIPARFLRRKSDKQRDKKRKEYTDLRRRA